MKKVRIISLLVILILILANATVFATDTFEVNLEPNSKTATRGETIQLELVLDNINMTEGEGGVAGYMATLSYDNTIFENVSIKDTDYWEADEIDGIIIVNAKDTIAVTQKTTTAILELQVKEDAKLGETVVSLENITGGDVQNSVDGTTTGATITIVEESELKLTEIIIVNEPDKTSYVIGEKFNPSGMEVQAKYDDGSTGVVYDYTYDPSGELTLDDKEVTIIYSEGDIVRFAKVGIKVTDEEVAEKELKKIEITKSPNKTTYNVGEKFDVSGMEITARYSDGTSEVINNYTYSPNGSLTKENSEITITYTEGEQTVEVKLPITVTGDGVLTPDEDEENPNQDENQENQDKTNSENESNNSNSDKNTNENDSKKDNSIANMIIPQTGTELIILPIVIIGLVVIAIIIYKKYKGIKQ